MICVKVKKNSSFFEYYILLRCQKPPFEGALGQKRLDRWTLDCFWNEYTYYLLFKNEAREKFILKFKIIQRHLKAGIRFLNIISVKF